MNRRSALPGARKLWLATGALILAATLLSAPPASAQSTTAYTYDPLGRLAQVTMSNGVTVTYSYDAAGNRTQTTTTGGGSSSHLVVLPLLGGYVLVLP